MDSQLRKDSNIDGKSPEEMFRLPFLGCPYFRKNFLNNELKLKKNYIEISENLRTWEEILWKNILYLINQVSK